MRPPRGGGGGRNGRGSRGGGPFRAHNNGGRGDGGGGRGVQGRGGGRGGSGGRGCGRGNGGGGMRGGSKGVIAIIPHRHEGVFIFKSSNSDALLTKNLVPGESVYNEKRIAIQGEDGTKVEYRVWNPFRSKLAAAILGGLDDIWITGLVYAVEFSPRSGRDLLDMAKKRTNVIPIIEDARYPARYRTLVGMVDVIFADVAQPDQARILALNAAYFLKVESHFLLSIKANCIDSTISAEKVYEREVSKLRDDELKAREMIEIDTYERNHAVVVGAYRKQKKQPPKS